MNHLLRSLPALVAVLAAASLAAPSTIGCTTVEIEGTDVASASSVASSGQGGANVGGASASSGGGQGGTGQGGASGVGGAGGTAGVGGAGGTAGAGGAGGAVGAGGAGGGLGSGGAGGAGGSGGAPPACVPDTGGDTCPGDTIPLTLGTVACYEGTLVGAKNDYGAKYCKTASNSSGPDHVYHLTFTGVGTLKLLYRALDKDFDPTLHYRLGSGVPADCNDANQEASCAYFLPTVEGFASEIDPAKTPDMYFFLDSATSPGGKYRLELSYNAPVCGDGVVSPSLMEECDDGNAVSGDGCDKDCKLEKAVAFDACPGEPFPITLNQTLTFFGNTAPYNDGDGVHSYHPVQAPGCTPSAYLSTARDRVYQLKAKANGTVTATVGLDLAGTMPICEIEPFSPFCWDRVLYAVAAIEPDTCGANCTCDSGMTIPGDSKNGKQLGAQLACSQKGLLSVEEVSFPVEKDRTYFIVVDGNTYSAYPYGPYYLRVALQ